MEKHKCKLCGRNFTNGKALGGHMKAHLATHPLPPKTAHGGGAAGDYYADSDPSSSSSSSGEEMEEKSLGYVLRENPKKSFRFADPEFAFAAGDSGSVVVQDRESETESKNPTRKRSKRIHPENQNKPDSKPGRVGPDPEPVSSISDTSPEEDVAMCLMLMSRDVWKVAAVEEAEAEEVKLVKIRGRFRCEKCGMGFRSQTALGGHKKICSDPVKKSIFQCPFCERVFGSGQALGGHKRSHMLPSNVAPPTPTRPERTPIDLNLPAPVEDDAFSVVSDA